MVECLFHMFITLPNFLSYYDWHFSPNWTPCSKTCGIGTRTRLTVCLKIDGEMRKTVEDSKCNITEVSFRVEDINPI